MSVWNGPNIVNSGLILHLDAGNTKSYSGSSTWFDLSGKGNHFTLNGSLTHNATTGFTGFTQANRWYRDNFPINLKLAQGGSGLTTCVWARCAGATATWQKLIGNGDEQNYIDLYASISNGTYRSECSSTLYYNNGINVASNSFNMGDGIWRMYIATNSNGGLLTNPGDAFGIGAEGDAFYNYPWNGNIAIVMMYNRILTTDEMTENFNSLRYRFNV